MPRAKPRPPIRRPAPPQKHRASPRGFEGSLYRRAIVWLVGLKILGILLIFYPPAIQVFDLPKSVFSRAIEWLLIPLLVLAVVRYGFAIVPRSPLHVFVVGYVFVNIVSTIFAHDRYLALHGDFNRDLGLTFVVDMAVLYAAVAIAFRSRMDWLIAASMAAAGFLIASGYGVLQSLKLDPVKWSAEHGRPASTFGNPDMFGHFVGVVFGAALATLLFHRGRYALGVRAIAFGVLGFTLFDAAIVATRATALGIFAVLVVLVLAYLRVHGVRSVVVARVAGGSAIALALMAALLVASPLGQRLAATLSGVQIRDRLAIYAPAIDAFFARPLLGYGPDNYAPAFALHRQPYTSSVLGEGFVAGATSLASSAHSIVLQAAATTGFFGVVALLSMLAAGAWRLWRHALGRDPALAAPLLLALAGYVGAALVTVGSLMVDWVPWLVLGGAASLDQGDPGELSSERRAHPAGVALLLATGVVGALSGQRALEADHLGWMAQGAVNERLPEIALRAANGAVQADSGRSRYWFILGRALDLRQRWRDAAQAYETAANRSSFTAGYWTNLALTRARQTLSGDESGGGREAVFAAARRAIEVDPNNPQGHITIAELANTFKMYDVALRESVIAIRLYSGDPRYDLIAAQAALGDSDVAAARTELEGLLAVKESALIRVTLAQLSEKLNDRGAALAHARRALEIDPQNQEATRIVEEQQ